MDGWGLETAILACFATLFTARLVVIYRANAAKGRDFAWLGLLAGLMFLTRYDSVTITAPILLAVLVVEYRRPTLWIGAVICVALVSSWLLFPARYYGDIFPTSFYLKLAIRGRPPVDSVSAILNFALVSGLIPILLLARRLNVGATPLSRAIQRGAMISVVLFLLYASLAAGQHMMFGFRLFAPYLMGAALVLSLAMPRPRWVIGGSMLHGRRSSRPSSCLLE